MIEVRPLHEIEQFGQCVGLQRTIWGFADVDVLPRRFFVVAEKIGGETLGAFDGDKLIGFLIAIPAIRHPSGEAYWHSHMLGVLEGYRDQGVGRMLKLAQRDSALHRGLRLIEWTFDPFELKNAYFNMERLGAVARRYIHNQYGVTSSPLHGGLPTDRLIAEYWIEGARAEAGAAGQQIPRGATVEQVEFPINIADLRRDNPIKARELQAAAADQFDDCFRRGLAITGFDRGPQVCAYLLSEWASE